MFYDGNKAYSPLICIGRNVPVGAGGAAGSIPCLCVSPYGRIAIVEPDPFRHGESGADFAARISGIVSELRKWDCDALDGVAADYFYDTTGQAARGIDIMALNGYLTLAAKQDFFNGVNAGLQKEDILIMVSVDPNELPMRKVEFSQGALGGSGLLFSLVEDEVGKQFLTEQ